MFSPIKHLDNLLDVKKIVDTIAHFHQEETPKEGSGRLQSTCIFANRPVSPCTSPSSLNGLNFLSSISRSRMLRMAWASRWNHEYSALRPHLSRSVMCST